MSLLLRIPLALAGALAALARIDTAGRDPRLEGVAIEVACNMGIRLCGPDGVGSGFGPRKGATPAEAARLQAGLERLAAVLECDAGAAGIGEMPGGGASGGLGAGLHALLGARLRPWQEVVLGVLELDRHLACCDLVLTAEGGLDVQTPRGKIPAEIGRRARRLGVPVIALAGTLGEGARDAHEHGIDAFFSTMAGPGTLEAAMRSAASDIALCAEQAVRGVLVGLGLARRRAEVAAAGTGGSAANAA